MKINTFYEYTTEKERKSLNIYSDDENIYFRVFINESEYTTYKYNIESKKLFQNKLKQNRVYEKSTSSLFYFRFKYFELQRYVVYFLYAYYYI